MAIALGAEGQMLTVHRTFRSHPVVTLVRGTVGARKPVTRGPAGGGIPHFDPFDPQVIADPASAYCRLHREGGIHYSPRHNLWTLSSYSYVRAAVRDDHVLSSASGVSHLHAKLPMMLTTDRPEHDRLRSLAMRHFTGKATERRRGLIQRLSKEGIADLLSSGELVSSIARPLPLLVIADILGVPSEDVDALRTWSDAIVEGFEGDGSISRRLHRGRHVTRAIIQLHAYLRELSKSDVQRVGQGSTDVLRALKQEHDESRLTSQEQFWFALMLLLAGNETTTNLIGSMGYALAVDSDSYDRLHDEPRLIAAAVEEAIRWGSPVQGLCRVAKEDYRIGAVTVPAGSRVLLSFGAANRDPDRFSNPDHFDIGRFAGDGPAEHLGFGHGIHHCLGAALARLESTVVLAHLVQEVRRIGLAGSPTWTRNPMLRGLEQLPLTLVQR